MKQTDCYLQKMTLGTFCNTVQPLFSVVMFIPKLFALYEWYIDPTCNGTVSQFIRSNADILDRFKVNGSHLHTSIAERMVLLFHLQFMDI